MSFMRKHQAKILAGRKQSTNHEPKKAAYTHETSMSNLSNAQKRYQLVLVSVQEDCKRLSDLTSIAERNTLKRDELVPKYQEYIVDYTKSGLNHPNEVITQNIIWLFDIGEIEQALHLALFAIEQEQKLPARFNRDLKTFIADEVFDWSELQIKAEKSAAPYFDQLFDLVIDGKWVVHEAVQLKYQKLAGIWQDCLGNFKQALLHFEAAEQIDPKKAKVKTRIAELKKHLDATEA